MARIFSDAYHPGMTKVPFNRNAIVEYAHQLGIAVPKNIGDVVYSFRYRAALPESKTG